MEAYTGFAAVYDTFMDNVPYGEWCEYLTGLLKENGVESGVVLDLGCGTGSLTELLAARGYDMIGIDYSEVSVIKSSKINKAEIENKHCEILQGNVMKLPFRKETFDIITAFETIYFWPDINEAFKQVYRVLKVSGTFMICNESNGENSKEEKWTKIIQGMKIYNSEQIKKSLEDAGFTDIKIHKNKKGWLCVVCKKG